MVKRILSVFFLFSTALSFGQIKVEDTTPITSGETIFLEKQGAEITPPKGYMYIKDYAAFVNNTNFTNISVSRKEGVDYDAFVKSVLNTNYETSNAKLIRSQEIGESYFFEFTFTIKAEPVTRIMLLKKDANDVVCAMANFNSKDKQKVYTLLKESILSLNVPMQ